MPADYASTDRPALVLLGYWLGEAAPGWPDPREFVDSAWDLDERQDVYFHLVHGMLARAYLGPSPCRFCGIRVGNLELTDGTFIWPEGLAHYVREHDVRLPARFVDHALDFKARWDEATVDETWWWNDATT